MRYLFLNIGYLTMIIVGIIFLYCIEKNKIYFYKKFFFTILFSVLGIVFVLIFFIDIELTQPSTYVYWITYIIFLFVYLKDFIEKVQKNRQKLVIGVLKFFPGVMLLILGFFMTTYIVTGTFGLQARFFGFLFQIIAISLLFNFYSTLPPFSEFYWDEAIEGIIIMNNAGLAIFEKKYSNKEEDYDGLLIGGALTSMKIILESITDSEARGISILEKKGKIITIFQSIELTGVIFSSRNLKTLQMLLKKFVLRMESLYASIIPDWNGDLSIFDSVQYIYNEIFNIEK